MAEFGFIGPGYQSRGKVGECERWVNLMLERIESGMGAARPTKYQALGTPGKALFCTLSDEPVSAVASSTNPFAVTGPLFFAAAGTTLFAIEAVPGPDGYPIGNPTTIGTIESSAILGLPGQLYPTQITVISNEFLFVLCPTGNIFLAAFGAAITSHALQTAGTGYAVGDTGGIVGGLISAVYTVTSVGGSGDVTGYTLTGGTGFEPNDYQTATGGPQPGVGAGFSIRVLTVAADAWLVSELNGSPLAPALTIGTFITAATFLDGYMIVSLAPNVRGPLRRVFYVSELNNPNVWHELDFGTKEAAPDPIFCVFAAYEILHVFGTQTMELWQNTGNALFAMQRMPGGGVIEEGIASPVAIAKAAGSLIWLSQNSRGQFSASMMTGSSIQRISTPAIENTWSAFDANGASIYTYEEGGHVFACFQWPIPDQTWVYDLTLNKAEGWHERATWDGSQFHADLGRYHGFAAGMHVVGDYNNGNLYLQSMDFFDENCNAIRRIRVCPHLVDEKKWHFYQRFRMHMLTGRVPPSTNPICSLRISNDGAQTYGSYLDMEMGLTGEYERMVEWYHLGRSRDRVFEWSCAEPIEIVLVEAYLESHAGAG